MDDFITVTEAARLLGITRVAIFKRIKSGKLKAEMVGGRYLIHRDEIGVPQRKSISKEEKKGIDSVVGRVLDEYEVALKLLKDT